MYGQPDNQEQQKKKIIIVSLAMGIIIIILIGVLISAITSKNKARLAEQQKQQETAIVREDEQQAPAKTETTQAEDEKLDPVANNESQTVKPSSDAKDLPQTGAGSILGLALLAGSATTYTFSKRK